MDAVSASTDAHHPLDDFYGDKAVPLDPASDVQRLGEMIQAMVAAAHPAYVPDLIQAQAVKIQKKLMKTTTAAAAPSEAASSPPPEKSGIHWLLDTIKQQTSDILDEEQHEVVLEKMDMAARAMAATMKLLQLELAILKLESEIKRQRETI